MKSTVIVKIDIPSRMNSITPASTHMSRFFYPVSLFFPYPLVWEGGVVSGTGPRPGDCGSGGSGVDCHTA